MEKFKKYLTRKILIPSAIGLLVFVGAVAAFVGGNSAEAYEYTEAAKHDVKQIISVTGQVKAAENVDLAFEKSGKVAKVYFKIGDLVKKGQILVALENGSNSGQVSQGRASVQSAEAQLAQYQAALDQQEAKLDELKSGTRTETINIDNTRITNAENTLMDAQTNLSNVENQAEINLINLYSEIPDILQSAFLNADNALNSQTSMMTKDENGQYPQLTFTVTDYQTQLDAASKRADAQDALDKFESELMNLPTEISEWDSQLNYSIDELTIVRTFLSRLQDALGLSTLDSTTLATYQANVNSAWTSINSAISSINSQKQNIASQLVSNANSIATAESNVSEANNSLESAKAQLLLDQAGPTLQEIAAQEAQVRSAEANLAYQKSRINEAKASLSSSYAEYTKAYLKAPFDGVVSKMDAKVGEIVSGSVVSMISQSKFELEASLPEADVAKVKVGDSAKVTFDALGSDVVFDTNISSIDPAEEMIEGVATYKIRLAFASDDLRVKSGMTANIDITGDQRDSVIAVLARSIIKKDGENYVKILDSDGSILLVKVATGLRGTDGYVEITEGVNEGDKVINFIEE